jgi:DNA-binding MarR family transcriptional regulator
MTDDGPDMSEAVAAFRRYVDAVVLHGQATADAVGLHATDLYALGVLAGEGRLTCGELAERTGLTTGAATRLVDRMERAGFVRRTSDEVDRRRVLVEPVPGSLPDLDAVLDPVREQLAEVFAGFDARELAVLTDYFARAAPAFRRASQEVRSRSAVRRRRGSPSGRASG